MSVEWETVKKPPLGVSPESIYEIHRIKELSRAIKEYIEYDYHLNKIDLILGWVEELNRRLNNLENLKKANCILK